jgi:hypothetical protein
MGKAKRTTLAVVVIETLLLTSFATTVLASGGMTGDCADCHTMHNSEQGQAVAQKGTTGTITTTPIANLLRMDCMACHAADPNGEKIITLSGGSAVPQVLHNDATGDLAGGNFRYIISGGNRKGHNVIDLVPADTENLFPPGHRLAHISQPIGEGGFDVDNFTCAGSMGCHGYRGQVLSTFTVECDEFGINVATGLPCTAEELDMSGIAQNTFRTGLNALSGYDGGGSTPVALRSGAHHQSYDGVKHDGLDPDFYDSPLAHSYRFIRSLRGYGNEVERWQNNSSTSHNEYVGGYENNAIGDLLKNTNYSTTTACTRCHIGGQKSTTSRLTVPGQSMTGFCLTCHGLFHSSGVTNGASGAFLRHPADYVIPDRDEYSAYTVYNVTAPVARPHAVFVDGMTPSQTVTPGEDLVMCLSCHMAHAGPYDAMLRFDYTEQTAGNATTGLGTGCLACHTTKGILPEDR